MFRKSKRTALGALLAAVALVVVAAAPAGAQPTPYDWDIVDGTAVVGDLDPIDFGEPDPDPCDVHTGWQTPVIHTDVEHTMSGATVDITGVSIPDSIGQAPNDDWYLLEFGLYAPGNNSGTVTGSHPDYTWNQHIALEITVTNLGTGPDEDDCEDVQHVCTIIVFAELDGDFDHGPPGLASLETESPGIALVDIDPVCGDPFLLNDVHFQPVHIEVEVESDYS